MLKFWLVFGQGPHLPLALVPSAHGLFLSVEHFCQLLLKDIHIIHIFCFAVSFLSSVELILEGVCHAKKQTGGNDNYLPLKQNGRKT